MTQAELERLLVSSIPAISNLAGRDLAPDFKAFFDGRTAVSRSLNEQSNVFLRQNWRTIPAFIETPEGRAAIIAFLNEWANSLAPKIESEPSAEQTQEEGGDITGQHGRKGGNNRK